MARMTGFIFQDEYLERLAKLSDEEVGRLIRALSVYHATGKAQELAGREGVAFDFIKVDIDRIDQKYEAKCETNSNNRQRSSTIVNDRQQSSTNADESEGTATKRTKDNNKDKVNDKEKDKEKEKKSGGSHSVAFHPPTIDEVKRYCFEKGYGIDAEKFVSYYESNGWRVGKNPMKDWKAACRTWTRNEFGNNKGKTIAQTNYTQRSYEETKPGELPDWYIKMIEDEQRKEAAEKAGINPVMPQWLAEEMLEEAMAK